MSSVGHRKGGVISSSIFENSEIPTSKGIINTVYIPCLVELPVQYKLVIFALNCHSNARNAVTQNW